MNRSSNHANCGSNSLFPRFGINSLHPSFYLWRRKGRCISSMTCVPRISSSFSRIVRPLLVHPTEKIPSIHELLIPARPEYFPLSPVIHSVGMICHCICSPAQALAFSPNTKQRGKSNGKNIIYYPCTSVCRPLESRNRLRQRHRNK